MYTLYIRCYREEMRDRTSARINLYAAIKFYFWHCFWVPVKFDIFSCVFFVVVVVVEINNNTFKLTRTSLHIAFKTKQNKSNVIEKESHISHIKAWK